MAHIGYTAADWDAEFWAVFAQRNVPPSCPACHRTGFFGPRRTHDRCYRLCKFCGMCQTPGHDPVQCLATVHRCSAWPTIAGASYIWWVQPDEIKYVCHYCGGEVQVAGAITKRPIEDPSHPWWKVPQDLSFDGAAQFWLQQGQARIYL